MKSINLVLISLFSVLMFLGEDAMAQRGRRGNDNSCVVPSRGVQTRDYNRNYGYTYRGNVNNRNPFVGTYYRNKRRLPNRADRIRYRGASFFYLDGMFYQERRRGFMVVNPPIGLEISRRPFDAERVKHRRRVYYRSGRYWFMKNQNSRGFVLVRNPFR